MRGVLIVIVAAAACTKTERIVVMEREPGAPASDPSFAPKLAVEPEREPGLVPQQAPAPAPERAPDPDPAIDPDIAPEAEATPGAAAAAAVGQEGCAAIEIPGAFSDACKTCLRTSCCTELRGCMAECAQGGANHTAMSQCMGGPCYNACIGKQLTGNKCMDTPCRSAGDCRAVGCSAGCGFAGRCNAF